MAGSSVAEGQIMQTRGRTRPPAPRIPGIRRAIATNVRGLYLSRRGTIGAKGGLGKIPDKPLPRLSGNAWGGSGLYS